MEYNFFRCKKEKPEQLKVVVLKQEGNILHKKAFGEITYENNKVTHCYLWPYEDGINDCDKINDHRLFDDLYDVCLGDKELPEEYEVFEDKEITKHIKDYLQKLI